MKNQISDKARLDVIVMSLLRMSREWDDHASQQDREWFAGCRSQRIW